MATCVPKERIGVNVAGIRTTVPYASNNPIPTYIPDKSMESCTESCQGGRCQPLNYKSVREQTIDNLPGGIDLPSQIVSEGVRVASIDECIDSCNSNSSCKALSHTQDGICNHYTNIDSQGSLSSGSTQVYSKVERT